MRAQLCREETIGLKVFRKNSEDCNFRKFENSEKYPIPKNTRSTVVIYRLYYSTLCGYLVLLSMLDNMSYSFTWSSHSFTHLPDPPDLSGAQTWLHWVELCPLECLTYCLWVTRISSLLLTWTTLCSASGTNTASWSPHSWDSRRMFSVLHPICRYRVYHSECIKFIHFCWSTNKTLMKCWHIVCSILPCNARW